MSVYAVNKLCRLVVHDPAFRAELSADPARVTATFEPPLTGEERVALLAGDVGRLSRLGRPRLPALPAAAVRHVRHHARLVPRQHERSARVNLAEVISDVRRGCCPRRSTATPSSSSSSASACSARRGCSWPTSRRSRRRATTSCAGSSTTRSSSSATSTGEIRVLFNMCLHRGMQVCRAERGQHVALPLPVPRVDVQEHRRAGRRAVPQGRLRRRGRACAAQGGRCCRRRASTLQRA